MALSSDEARKLRAELEASVEAQTRLETSIKGLASQYADIYKLSINIRNAEAKQAANLKEIEKIEKKLNAQQNSNLGLTQAQVDKLQDELDLRKEILATNQKDIDQYKEKNKQLQKQATSLANIGSAIGGSILVEAKKVFLEFDKWDKAARTTAVSMGLTGKNVDGFRRSLNKVAYTTADIGVSYEKLAKMQGKYSSETGRAVILNDKALVGLASMSVVLDKSVEDVGLIAADFFTMGMSADAVTDRMQEAIDLSSRMGLNSVKVIDIMTKNLKLAQKYNFKKGTENLMNMAAMSTKFKIDLASVAGMADKLFNPEGAVEMAASLQVLGGQFAMMADPFKLMFMARNDMEALTGQIIEATKGLVTFNKETGELNLSAQELHRLKEVANATGLDLDNLVETARAYAQVDFVKKDIGVNIDPKFEDFITSSATWDKNQKGWAITLVDEYGAKRSKLVKEMNQNEIKMAYNENEALLKRAEQQQTFLDMWKNLWMKIQAGLIPIVQGFSDVLREPIKLLIAKLSDKNVIQKLTDVAIGIYKTVDWIIDKIDKLGVGTVALIAGGAALAFGAVKWFANGVTLGMGFNTVARVGGMPMGGGMGGGMMGGGKGMLGPGLIAGGVGLGSMLLNNYLKGNGTYEEGSGWDKGLDTMGYMGMGAMMGSMFGPWGMAAGAAIGGGYGVYKNYGDEIAENPWLLALGPLAPAAIAASGFGAFGDKNATGSAIPNLNMPSLGMANDFISRPGEGLTKINSSDTVVGAKSGGPIDKMFKNNESGGYGVSSLSIDFKPLKIEFGSIELKIDNKSITINDFQNNPQLTRELSRMIQEEVRMAIGGGKLSPNVAS